MQEIVLEIRLKPKESIDLKTMQDELNILLLGYVKYEEITRLRISKVDCDE